MAKANPEGKNKFDPAIVLKDTKNFSDEIEVTLPNGAIMTLGDLREYDSATQGSVQKELAKGQAALEAERRKIDAASNSVAQMYVDLEKQKAALAEGGGGRSRVREEVDPLDEVLANDPVYTRLSKKYSDLEAKQDALLKKLDDGFGNVSKTLNEVGSTYLNERYEQDWRELSTREDAARPKDLNLESLYKYAADNGIKKRNGIIDLNRAYEQYTMPKRMELEKASEYERGKAEGEKARNLDNMMPKPGFGPAIPGLDKVIHGQEPAKNLTEAFAAAAHDPAIWGVQGSN